MELSSLALALVLTVPPVKMVSMAVDRKGWKPFKMDVTEVTVAAYAECVDRGKCTEPATRQFCNWQQSRRDKHPITCVTWLQADAYCKSQGKRLPDSSEWYFAATNGITTPFPWGNELPDESRACFHRHLDDGTCPVGAYPAGANQGGIQDLSGNVAEWTSLEVDGNRMVVVGSTYRASGNRHSENASLRAYKMDGSRQEKSYGAFEKTRQDPEIGFRCAKDL